MAGGAGRAPGGRRPGLAGDQARGGALPAASRHSSPRTSKHLTTNTLISCCLQPALRRARGSARVQLAPVPAHGAFPREPRPPSAPVPQPSHSMTRIHQFPKQPGSPYKSAPGPAPGPRRHTSSKGPSRWKLQSPQGRPTCQPTSQTNWVWNSWRRLWAPSSPFHRSHAIVCQLRSSPQGMLLGETKALPSRHKLDTAQPGCPYCLEGQAPPCPRNWHNPPGTTSWASLCKAGGYPGRAWHRLAPAPGQTSDRHNRESRPHQPHVPPAGHCPRSQELGPRRAACAHRECTGASEESVLVTALPAKRPWLRTRPPTPPTRPPSLLLSLPAVHSLAPLGEAVIENGPSDSIRIQSPSETRGWAGSGGGRKGGVQEGTTTHSSPAFPSRPPVTAGLGGGVRERGQPFAARL